jgi:copper chaperone
MKKSYRVDGMTCDGCANAVKRALTRLDARSVDVDLGLGRVTVDGDIDDARIAQAVEAAGFTYAGPLAGS